MRYADLHLHTNHSDGTRDPREVIDLAVRHRLQILAISDHDNLAAYHEIRGYAESRDILLIPAVELSAEHRGVDIHILAYSFDPSDELIEQRLTSFRETRRMRGHLIVEKLRELGYPLEITRVEEICGTGALGRPHVARAMLERGYVTSFEEAFTRFLGNDCPAWVPKERFSIPDAVSMIRTAGGVTSIAHPSLYSDHRILVPEILDLGVDGVEILHPNMSKPDRRHYGNVVRDRRLIATGGSDDHGKAKTSETIGTIRLQESEIRPILERMESLIASS